MEILKKIFSMKTYAILYTIGLFIFYLIGSSGSDTLDEWTSPYGSFLLIAVSAMLCFGLSICYAVGWKKKLYSNAVAALLTIFSIIIYFLTALKWVIDDAVQNGASSFVIFLGLIFGFLYLLLLYIPVFIPTVIYFIKSEKYEVTTKPVIKILFAFFLYNMLYTFAQIIVERHVFPGIFDYYDLVAGIIATAIGICYAWDIKLRCKGLVQLLVIFSAIGCCLPVSVFSPEYKTFSEITLTTSNWLGLLFYIGLSVFNVIIMYRYAFTKEIYASEIKAVSEKETE